VSHLNDHLKDWFTTIEQLQAMLKNYHQDRLVYDHYLEKVERLRFVVNSERRGDPKSNDQLQRVVSNYH
jgi:hypothetical protein